MNTVYTVQKNIVNNIRKKEIFLFILKFLFLTVRIRKKNSPPMVVQEESGQKQTLRSSL